MAEFNFERVVVELGPITLCNTTDLGPLLVKGTGTVTRTPIESFGEVPDGPVERVVGVVTLVFDERAIPGVSDVTATVCEDRTVRVVTEEV